MAEPRGEKLTDEKELLLRQAHPSYFKEGRWTFQVFCPASSDEGLLSVSRGSMTTPKDAYQLHIEKKKLRSSGVFGFTMGDCTPLGLPCHADPEPDPEKHDPAHAVVDFRAHGNKQREKKAKVLKEKALAAGLLFDPNATPRAA